jgi:hypothetical protein
VNWNRRPSSFGVTCVRVGWCAHAQSEQGYGDAILSESYDRSCFVMIPTRLSTEVTNLRPVSTMSRPSGSSKRHLFPGRRHLSGVGANATTLRRHKRERRSTGDGNLSRTFRLCVWVPWCSRPILNRRTLSFRSFSEHMPNVAQGASSCLRSRETCKHVSCFSRN